MSYGVASHILSKVSVCIAPLPSSNNPRAATQHNVMTMSVVKCFCEVSDWDEQR